MKKIIFSIPVLALLVLTSCVKERDCNCTTTITYAGGSHVSTDKIVYKDVTKTQAKTLCASYTTTDDSGVVTTQDCKLK
ncbi:MAG: hypothetical protein ABI315_04215 [Bacteroidia bacterium]